MVIYDTLAAGSASRIYRASTSMADMTALKITRHMQAPAKIFFLETPFCINR